MFFTPTDKGALFGGAGMWALGWATLFKLDKLPIVNRFFKREKSLLWINQNKVVTLMGTEFINFAIHGVSNPTGVLFALGGTFVNTIMVFFGVPLTLRRQEKARAQHLMKGVA